MYIPHESEGETEYILQETEHLVIEDDGRSTLHMLDQKEEEPIKFHNRKGSMDSSINFAKLNELAERRKQVRDIR